MATEFKFPDVGEGITEGEIVKWLVKEGDTIKEHDTIAEVETDKAIVEMPSPVSGKVLKLNYKEGATVKVGEVLAVIGNEGEPVVKPAGAVGYLEEASEVTQTKAAQPVESSSQVLATPAVRRMARDAGVDISKVTGTGEAGRVTEGDLKATKAPEVKIAKKYDMYGYVERVALRGIRKATAARVSDAVNHQALVTSMDEVDVTELVRIREKEKVEAEKKGAHLTYLPFIIKAVVEGLKEFPHLNSELNEEGQEIILKKYYNIGIAVDTPEGLMVPVVKGANQKSMLDIAKEIENFADKAQKREIDLGDLKGGTFTITNIGVLGGTFFTPIPNYPETAILGTGMIHDKAVVVDGEVVVKKVMPLSLTFDHRVLDGAMAQRFLNTVMTHLNDPASILVELR
ncbi:2-oxo acid dehydrogenase subunit E2 [archaeon]|nr:MAG: 2-oxo acid dehydrogenase subunit E2 [archaeon]